MNDHRPIYLDNNSTTPMLPEVTEAIRQCYAMGLGNPASAHFAGRTARKLVEESRERIMEILHARTAPPADRLIFTSGGTESNNLALLGFTSGRAGRIVISAIEHPSVLGTVQQLAHAGYDIQRVRVNRQGIVDPSHLSELVDESTLLVSVMLANNEIGVVQPIAEIAQCCAPSGTTFHTDAVQAVGKVEVDFPALGAAALSFSAHKFHGPPGIGGLLLRGDTVPRPILYGGFQQDGIRPGTENVALVVGMCQALAAWHATKSEHERKLAALRDAFESRLKSATDQAVVVNGSGVERLPHTSSVSFPGVDRQVLLLALDRAGIACSAGSACASGSSEPSHVLQAMGCPQEVVTGAIRVSFGRQNELQEVVWAADQILCKVRQLRSRGLFRGDP